jgi:hypothetical protein
MLPSYINIHFGTKLHKLSKKEQQEISEKVRNINGLISNKETLRRSKFTFLLVTLWLIAALGKPEKNRL